MQHFEQVICTRKLRAVLGALLCLMLLGEWARASPPSKAPELPTDPLLATLIEQSLTVLPELAQARASVKADRERVPQAGALPDPMLQLGVQNDGFTSWEVGKMETSYYSIMASQTLPWPGKLRLKSEVAELGANQAEENVARVRLSTEAEVRRVYLSLILANDRLTLLDRLDAIWQKSAALARIRYETGQGAQSDVFRAQLELNRIRQRRWALQAEADTQVQALNRLRGHPLDEPIAASSHLVDLVPPALNDDSAAAQDAFDRSPELASARLGLPQAEKSVALARKSYFPDFTVSAGVMPRGGDFPPMWLLSVGFTLPVFTGSKQSRAVAESEARVLANQKNVEGLEQVLRLRVRQRRTSLAATLETIRLYQDGLLVQSEATVDSTLAQYKVGRVTFASVLEANAGLIADQDGYLQTLAQAQRLAIDSLEVRLAPVSPASAGMGTTANASASSPSGGTATSNPTGDSSSSM
jgi:cobalt-zinc-cadmium efflux system outer membrane protein